MPRQWTDEQRQEAKERLAKARAAKQQKQTDTPKQTAHVETETPSPSAAPTIGGVQLSTEQFEALIAALTKGNSSSPATATNSFNAGLQTNAQGQVVGTKDLYNPDPDFYPSPVEELTAYFETEPKLRRFGFSYNYFLDWKVTAKPYQTKDGFMQREPTFNATLYATVFDDNGEDTGQFRIVQALQMNEDRDEAIDWAASNRIDVTPESMREIMDKSRFERVKRWLLAIFFTENNYTLNTQSNETVVDGQVVRIITKSNVQGYNAAPKITAEELQ